MAGSVKNWVNNSAPQCEADDLNGFKDENNNLIIGSGQALDDADHQQTHKAVSVYAHGGAFYTDGGAANAYVLSVIGSKVAPPALFVGMAVSFYPANANTGSSTINVASLGVKSAVLPGGAALPSGILSINYMYTFVYDGTNFVLNEAYSFGGQPVTYFIKSNAGPQVLNDALTVQKKLMAKSGAGGALNPNDCGFVFDGDPDSGLFSASDGTIDLYINGSVIMASSSGTVNFSVANLQHNSNAVWHAGNIAAGTRGALAYLNASQSITNNVGTAVQFNAENYDTDALHDNVTNNTRMTVPSGVSKIRLNANVKWGLNTTGQRFIAFWKNGAVFNGDSQSSVETITAAIPSASGKGPLQQIESPILNVSPGDYFEVVVIQNSGGALNVLGGSAGSSIESYFSMEIIQ